MINRLVDTGRKYRMEININKSQVMRTVIANKKKLIILNTVPWKCVSKNGYCARKIKTKIATTEEGFSRKISLLGSKPDIELTRKLLKSIYVYYL